MDIADWRKKIDELDRKLVELLSERAQAAHEIGKLKKNVVMPIYEPDREHEVFENVQKANKGPAAGPRVAEDLRARNGRNASDSERGNCSADAGRSATGDRSSITKSMIEELSLASSVLN